MKILSNVLLLSVLTLGACKDTDPEKSTSKTEAPAPQPVVTPVVVVTPVPTVVPPVDNGGGNQLGLILPVLSTYCTSGLAGTEGMLKFLCGMFASAPSTP